MKHKHATSLSRLLFWVLTGVIILALFFTIIPSGTNACWDGRCGILFWDAHEHDGIWHLALSDFSLRTWPFYLPNFSGEVLSGYNYLLDLVLLAMSYLGIPSIVTYFKVLPVVWAGLFIYLSIRFADSLLKQKSYLFRGLLLFFFLLSGSFAYVVRFYHAGTIWRSGGMSVMQSSQVLTNLQYAFSLCIVLIALNMMRQGKRSFSSFVVFALLIFIAVGLKVYAGIVLAVMLGTYALLLLVKEKKPLHFIYQTLILLVGFFASIYMFYGVKGLMGGSSTFIWKPFAIVNPIIEQQDLFYLPKVALARYYLESTGRIGIKLVGIWFFSTALFLMFNFGTRFLAFIELVLLGIKGKLRLFDIVVSVGILFGTIMPILFIQRGGWWNTIQFMYYALFLTNIYAAFFIYRVLKNLQWTMGLFVLVLVVLFTIPSSIDIFRKYTLLPPNSYIPQEELIALNFLKDRPQGVVLTDVWKRTRGYSFKSSPIPLFAGIDSSYLPIFTRKPVYYVNEMQLELLNINYRTRKEDIAARSCSVLGDVDYIYQYKKERLAQELAKKCKTRLKKIFHNDFVTIYSKI